MSSPWVPDQPHRGDRVRLASRAVLRVLDVSPTRGVLWCQERPPSDVTRWETPAEWRARTIAGDRLEPRR